MQSGKNKTLSAIGFFARTTEQKQQFLKATFTTLRQQGYTDTEIIHLLNNRLRG